LRVGPDGFRRGLVSGASEEVRSVAEGVLNVARDMSGQDWTMRKLMKKARLPRLGKALS